MYYMIILSVIHVLWKLGQVHDTVILLVLKVT